MSGYSLSVDYETGADGDAGSIGNTKCDTLRYSAGAGTSVISSAEHHSGIVSLHMTGTATSGLDCQEYTVGGVAGFTTDFWMKLPTLPSGETAIARLLDASFAAQAQLGVNNVGALVIRNAAGTTIYSDPSGKRIAAGVWIRVVWDSVAGASGTQRVRWYNAAGVLQDDSTTVASANGSSAFGYLRHGAKANTTTVTSEIYFDDLALTGTNPAAASAGPDQSVEPWATVTLDASASTGSGTWSMVSNSSHASPALSSTSAVQPTYTAPADWHTGSVQVWRYTLADGVTSDDVYVTVAPATVGLTVNPASNSVTALRVTAA